MKFTSSIKLLSDAVSSAALALPAKATDFRYESVTLTLDKKKLSLFASDGDISFTSSIHVESGDKGTVLLQAKRFQDILRSLYDTVAEFKTDKKEVDGELSFSIKTDRGSYKISGSSGKGETDAKHHEYDVEFSLTSEGLKHLADNTLFAASVDSMRPAMMGVLFELEPHQLKSVTTDGHRLVRLTKKMETGAPNKMKIIIPSRVLGIVQKTLKAEEDVKVSVNAKSERVRFVFGDTTIVASLITENYPNYEAVIPLENDKNMIVNRSNMLGTVKRVARFSSRGDVRFQIDGKEVKVSAENADEGSAAEESITCDYKSEKLQIGFNAKFVEDALSHLTSEEVVFEFSSPTRAAILRPKLDEKTGDDLLMLVMPVRINN
jgi:DNA polymerase-3 subunit beta